jgi:hypothetical protein
MKHSGASAIAQSETSVSEASVPQEPRAVRADAEEFPEAVRRVLEAASSEDAIRARSTPGAAAETNDAFGSLGLAQIVDVRTAEVDVSIAGRIFTARAAEYVHRAVLDTAAATGEPVLIERALDGSLTVVGALSARPTPGIDAMDEITLEARRITLRARDELRLSSGVASLVLRAAGEIESYAESIVSKAEELHKIVGRMLRLN